MSDHNSASEHTPENTSEHMSEHISSLGSCIAIWLALLAGTTLTMATIKATLVVLFFMHVKYTHEKLTGLVIVSAIFFLFILLALSMADYTTRLWRSRRWPNVAPPSRRPWHCPH